MRIFLTGVTGFLGSHTARAILNSGRHELAFLVRPGADMGRIFDLLPHAAIIGGDLRHVDEFAGCVRSFKPDAVVHLAWRGVKNSARNDAAQRANVDQTCALVHLAHAAGAKHWIGLGSQAEYGPHPTRIDEQTPARPTTLYGTAKLAALREAKFLCENLGLRFAWLRLFSAYGPGDDPSWLIPSVALKLFRGERPAVTAGEQLWDYVYAADAAAAIVAVCERPAASGMFNLASGSTATVRSIVEQVRDLIDPAAQVGFGEVPYRPDQVMRMEADIAKLCRATDWRPRTPLAEGLRRTVDWCREIAFNLAAA